LKYAIPGAIFCVLAFTAYMTQHTINNRGQDADPSQNPMQLSVAIKEEPQNFPPIALTDAETIAGMLEAATGKVVVLNLWATWCAPCVAEMPELVQFYRDYHGEDLTFISISADDPDTITTAVEPFQKQLRLNFPIYVLGRKDPALLSKILKGHFVDKYPTTYVYDRQGGAKKVWEGAITLRTLEQLVAPLL
jgi:thiol-disulfide isomerase/thioredoxin